MTVSRRTVLLAGIATLASTAAAQDPTHFGTRWWTNREWAKTALDEWVKLAWWEMVDRWK